MKRLVLFYFVLFYFVITSKGQNLVSNPSFENYIDCNSARLDNAIGWNSTCNGAGICTYYLNCQIDPFYSSPYQYLDNCFKSYQPARTGQAYTLFGVYVQNVTNQESNHPSIKLIDTLKAGKIYCVTYYVSVFNNAIYTIDKLGALFTPTPFPYYITGTTTPTVAIVGHYIPQVVTAPNIVIGDTLNWVEVSGSFLAIGNEAYLTLGDFFYHNQHLVNNTYPSNCNAVALYYVDDVSVEVVEIAKAKNDTLIYQGDSVLVGANNSEAALFSWQPTAGLSCTNCPNPKASPTVNTTYTVTKTQCKAVTNDVITVSVSPTGLFEYSKERGRMKIYPNPNNGSFVLSYQLKDNIQADIMVEDIRGRLIYQNKLDTQSNELILQLNSVNSGIYFVKVMNGKETISVNKVIINR
jgi:hypothetical protein